MTFMKYIYFDNSASAIPNEKALSAFAEAAAWYANPSSIHSFGFEVRKMVESARKNVADALCTLPECVTFTSSGTESNNIAVKASALKNRHNGNVIVTTEAEHPSVGETVKALEKDGFKTVYISVNGGELDYAELENVLRTEKVCLTALMQANNQNGAVTDLKRVREIINVSGSKTLFHSDMVQGFLKVKDEFRNYGALYCDTASVSAHKIGGVKGCGALYIRKGLVLSPIMYGGEQEKGLRSGTENVPGICAFGEAAKQFDCEKKKRITELRCKFISLASEELKDRIEFKIPENHIDALINISLCGVKSEVALNYLSSKNICVSASSACSAKAKENTVLSSFGYGKTYNDSALRIGFSPYNTEEEVEILVKELKNAANFRYKR